MREQVLPHVVQHRHEDERPTPVVAVEERQAKLSGRASHVRHSEEGWVVQRGSP